jgi:hypothetical protein
MNKRLKLILLLCAIACCGVHAQRNFYHRIDVGTSNVYPFVISNIITGYANYYTNDILFDDSYVYTLYSGDLQTKAMNPMGVTASDLFNDVFAGVKLGYKTDNLSSFNWGVYLSGHYRINQIQTRIDESADYTKECFQYIKPGAGFLLTFGSVENKLTVELEGAVRYDIPLNYKGMFGDDKSEVMKSGLSSHYSLKFAGHHSFSLGAFFDMTHYNIYKTSAIKFKPYSFGVTITITPKRGHDLYD